MTVDHQAEAVKRQAVMETVNTQAETVQRLVQGAIERLDTDELNYADGISLLSCKNDMALAYVHNLVHILLAKAIGRPLNQDTVVDGLVKQRLVLDKIKPLESKLRYQIQKLITKADNVEAGQSLDDSAVDPLSFKPNPAALVSIRNGRSQSPQSDQDGQQETSGIYRPPRLSAVPYPTTTTDKRKKNNNPNNTATSKLLAELSTAITADTPYAETTSGLSVAQSGALSSRKARKLDEINNYEEENFTRLPMSKKAARQRRIDEEEVALGGGASATDLDSARRRRAQVGFGAEMDEILDAIDRSGRKQSGPMNRTGGDEYEALRSMRKERSAPDSAVETSRKKRKGGFDVSMQRNEKKTRRKLK